MYLTKMIDSLGARWQRLTPRVARKAIDYAKSKGAARVFCGHTHEPTTRTEKTIEYFNAGAWTGDRPTFITLRGQEVKIHEFNKRINGHHPGEERRNLAPQVVDVA
jgi:UDP-2,3-diacylglucosamine pyrophosphatase LpxH